MKNQLRKCCLIGSLCCLIQWAQAQNRQADSLSLVLLFDSTQGIVWSYPWNLSQTMDQWMGVNLDSNGRVISLSLSGRRLAGPIPNLNLTSLQRLNLSRNQLTGVVPDFSTCPMLEDLFLGDNQLTGAIPNFSNLPLLLHVDVQNNQLTGVIPDFSNLPLLSSLMFSDNQLTGVIPDFSNLPRLSHLIGKNNQLSGSLPDFSNLPWLFSIDLENNQLTGTLPAFHNLPRLGRLNVRNNQLTGTIPNFKTPLLEQLFLDHNQFNGGLPALDSVPALKYVHVYYNQLTGGIPDLKNLPLLESYLVNDNKLDGTIPAFTQMNTRFRFYIHHNAFTFEDFIANIDSISAKTNLLSYHVQDSIGQTDTIAVTIGATHSIDLVIDDFVSSNIYYWYKDAVLVDSTFGINEYTISNFQATDAGTYTARITNSIAAGIYAFSTLNLHSRPITLTASTLTPIQNQVETPFYIAPNPTVGPLSIYTNNLVGTFSVQVTDRYGRLIQELEGDSTSTFQLSLANQATGIYFIHLKQGNQIWKKKIIKQ